MGKCPIDGSPNGNYQEKNPKISWMFFGSWGLCGANKREKRKHAQHLTTPSAEFYREFYCCFEGIHTRTDTANKMTSTAIRVSPVVTSNGLLIATASTIT